MTSYKKICLILTALSLCASICSAADPSQVNQNESFWNIKKSEHYVIYYRSAPAEYVDQVIKFSEDYYRTVVTELGFTRFDQFWTWDKRAKIYLYNDAKEYQLYAKQPEWSGAAANVFTREIKTYINMRYFFKSILPHELGHLIFREMVGYDKRLPIWLDEGVVSYLEQDYKKERLGISKALVKGGKYMTIEDLTNVRTLEGFLLPDIFYAEASSIIEFLVQEYGKDKFLSFCAKIKDLKDYQNWEMALKDAYGFNNLTEMDEKWVAFLRK
jgi:hypothetical protein